MPAFSLSVRDEEPRPEARHDRFRTGVTADIPLSPSVREIIHHLCQEPCPTYGVVREWCETRGDCQQAIVCPDCSAQFLVDDNELIELRHWTDAFGVALICGVHWE